MSTRKRFPWFRLLITLGLHVGLIFVGSYEYQAHKLKRQAEALAKQEGTGPGDVAPIYRQVIADYPLSWAVPEARQRLHQAEAQLQNSDDPEIAPATSPTWLQRHVLSNFDPFRYDQMPIAGFSVAALAVGFVFITRLLTRPITALLAGVLTLVFGLIAGLLWLPPLMAERAGEIASLLSPQSWLPLSTRQWYLAAWVAIAVAAIMLLTPASRRHRPASDAKPAPAPTRRTKAPSHTPPAASTDSPDSPPASPPDSRTSPQSSS